jgi:hypothetical protein
MELIRYNNDECFDAFLDLHLDETFHEFKANGFNDKELPQMFIIMDDGNLPAGYLWLNSACLKSQVWYGHDFDKFPKPERDILYDLAIAECKKYHADTLIEHLQAEKLDTGWDELRMNAINARLKLESTSE